MSARSVVRGIGASALCVVALARGAQGQAPCRPEADSRDDNVSLLSVRTPRPVIAVRDTAQLSVLGQTTRRIPCRARAAVTSSNVNVVRLIGGDRIVAVAPGVATIRAELTVRWSYQRGTLDLPNSARLAPLSGEVRVLVGVTVVSVVARGAMATEVMPGAPGGVMPPFPGGRPPDLPRMPRVFVFREDVEPVRPASDSAWLEQAGLLVDRLDDAAQRLVETFRNTVGAPLVGATTPMMLSGRERYRWDACGRVSEAFAAYGRAVRELARVPLHLPAGASASQSADVLALALERMSAVPACGEVARLFRSPGGDPEWASVYSTAASRFHGGWYAELRTVHEATRDMARAVRPLWPAGRVMVIPAPLPASPPTIGTR